jgi:hypothetical protein
MFPFAFAAQSSFLLLLYITVMGWGFQKPCPFILAIGVPLVDA